jgi:hypothetical protein
MNIKDFDFEKFDDEFKTYIWKNKYSTRLYAMAEVLCKYDDCDDKLGMISVIINSRLKHIGCSDGLISVSTAIDDLYSDEWFDGYIKKIKKYKMFCFLFGFSCLIITNAITIVTGFPYNAIGSLIYISFILCDMKYRLDKPLLEKN